MKFLYRSLFVLAALLAFLATPVTTQAALSLDPQVFLKKWCGKQKITSAVVSIQDTHSGQTTDYTYGTTLLYGHTPVTTGKIFGVGGITKTFVAAAILQLQEEGKLKLDDSLGTYVSHYPRWKAITIRQLLNMTSGITDFTTLPNFQAIEQRNSKKVISTDSLITMAYDAPDQYSPGTSWNYSNTNYCLLGLLIEKVTKKSLSKTFKHRFFRPLHLSHTYYSTSLYPKRILKKMAHAYAGNKDITSFNPSFYGASGAIVMDAYDLMNWTAALFTPRVILKSSSIDELKKAIPIPSISGTQYGLGVYSFKKPIKGTCWYCPGVTRGYTSCFVYIPNQHKILVAQVATWPEEHADMLLPGQPLLQKFLNTP